MSFKYFLNFFIRSIGYLNLSLLLIANLSLADRDRILWYISFFEGRNTLFLYSSNKIVSLNLSSGKYLEGLDLFFE